MSTVQTTPLWPSKLPARMPLSVHHRLMLLSCRAGQKHVKPMIVSPSTAPDVFTQTHSCLRACIPALALPTYLAACDQQIALCIEPAMQRQASWSVMPRDFSAGRLAGGHCCTTVMPRY
jgi:hypothetical protein